MGDPLNLPTQREINIISGKMLVAAATAQECHTFLRYVSEIESLLDEADLDDYFGTEGWRRRIGWDS